MQDLTLRTQTDGQKSALYAGAILLVATLLEIVAMAHHPSVSTADTKEAMLEIGRAANAAGIVHALLIGLMLLIAYGLSEFFLQSGIKRPLIRAGAIAYGIGVVGMVGAALVSGFLVPGVAASTPHSNAIDLQIAAQLLVLCHLMNQTCANFATIAMSAGITLLSVDLLRDAGPRRLVGALGVLSGAVPAIGLFSGLLHLNVHGMASVIVFQGAWNLAIALLLMRA